MITRNTLPIDLDYITFEVSYVLDEGESDYDVSPSSTLSLDKITCHQYNVYSDIYDVVATLGTGTNGYQILDKAIENAQPNTMIPVVINKMKLHVYLDNDKDIEKITIPLEGINNDVKDIVLILTQYTDNVIEYFREEIFKYEE